MQEERKNKHMTLQDRIEIQECLSKGMTFKAIAKRVGKSPTTISREVTQHATWQHNGFVKTDEECPLLLKAPFVCNNYSKKTNFGCVHPRRTYIAKHAHMEYRTVLVEAREGIPLTKEEFYQHEKVISDAVRAGQHIFHAINANRLPVSKTTVYRHIHKGYYSIAPLDLPRAVKFKPRTKHCANYVPQRIRVGRTYPDYLAYTAENPYINIVEMDTVVGRTGGKVIMTFQFTNVDFMFGILLENKSAAEAAAKITILKQKLLEPVFVLGMFSRCCLLTTAVNSAVLLCLRTPSPAARKLPCFSVILTLPTKSPTWKTITRFSDSSLPRVVPSMASPRTP